MLRFPDGLCNAEASQFFLFFRRVVKGLKLLVDYCTLVLYWEICLCTTGLQYICVCKQDIILQNDILRDITSILLGHDWLRYCTSH